MELRESSAEIKNHIHQCLQDYNRSYMNEYRDFSFHLEEDGIVIAGVVAESVSDTIEVSYLYVEESHRKKGLGKRLLSALEENGRKAGMKRILLNTYSFQAPEFYKKCGFEQIAEIDPCFGNHAQFYFRKTIEALQPWESDRLDNSNMGLK